MASSLVEITSEPSQPDLLTSDAMQRRLSSSSELLARWRQAARPLNGGLPSDYARPLEILLHPTDEELVEIWDGTDPNRSWLRERYLRTLRRKEILRSRSPLASRQHARGVAESDNDYLPGYVFECETCGGQSPTLQSFGGRHGSILLKSPRRSRMCNHVSRGEFNGLAHVDSAIDILEEGEMCVPREGPRRPLGLHDGNISGEGTSTMPNHISRATSPTSVFDGLAHGDIAIDIPEEGGSCVHSSDHTRPVRGFPILAILGDPLFDVNVQGAFALVAFKTGNASSPAQDALLYLLVFLYVFGFLSALGGKVFRSSKTQMSGSAATVLGFLLTMVLRLL